MLNLTAVLTKYKQIMINRYMATSPTTIKIGGYLLSFLAPVINIGFIKVNVVHSAAMINIGINLPMKTSSQRKTNRAAGDNYGDNNLVSNREVCLIDNDLEDFQVKSIDFA